MSKKNQQVPSLPQYEENEYDEIALRKSKERTRTLARKMPTSVTLPPEVVEDLKTLAQKKGIPYQVLMRSFILEGLEKMKKSS